MGNLPSGTVTFLFTDIEGSTRLAQQYPDSIAGLLERHHCILQAAIVAHGGYVFQVIGDAFCAAFATARAALEAAIDAQRCLAAENWSPEPIRVRMGISTGTAHVRLEDDRQPDYSGYVSLARANRVMSSACGGQILLADITAGLLRSDLPPDVRFEDLGAHELKSLLSSEHLWQVVAPGLVSDFPALKSIARVPDNLPVPLTTLIGRHQELSDIADLLLAKRLVTLTGAGGVGKTRLAIETARAVADAFTGGILYVELAAIREPAAVPERLRGLLHIKGTVHDSQSVIDLLCGYLRSRHALLVLDNCEHLIDACAHLVDVLLASCPPLHILATSREALRVGSELAYRVPSLPVPPLGNVYDAAALAQIDSVALFMERARARSSTLALTDQNAHFVAEICARLDGIPLALELAAARVSALPLPSMVEHLKDRFALLSGGLRTEIPRHQTLRAMIDWSYDLLSEPERVLLRRLSVFAGGWTLEAAQKVAAYGVLRENDVLGLLPELVEKSLVVLNASSGRYHMLETVREYALDCLRQASEEEAARIRHLDYFLMLAEASDLAAIQGHAASAALVIERDNFVSALAWSERAEGGVQKGLLLIGATRLIWLLVPDTDQPYRWARRLLSLPGAEPRNFARCRALLTLVLAAFYNGRATDPDTLSASEESVAIAREIGDRRRLAQALNFYGALLAMTGHPKMGLQCQEEAVVLARELGLVRLVGKILSDMADILFASRDFDTAESLYEQAIGVQEPLRIQDGIFSLLNASTLAIVRNNLDEARQRLLHGITLMHEIPRGMSDPAPPLQTSGSFLAASGDWRHAAVLFGAAERQRELENRALERADQLYSLPLVEKTCQALGEAEFHAAWTEGRRLLAQDAIALAQDWLGSPAA